MPDLPSAGGGRCPPLQGALMRALLGACVVAGAYYDSCRPVGLPPAPVGRLGAGLGVALWGGLVPHTTAAVPLVALACEA